MKILDWLLGLFGLIYCADHHRISREGFYGGCDICDAEVDAGVDAQMAEIEKQKAQYFEERGY